MNHLDDIRRSLESNNTLIVLGSGVTAASVSDTTNCSWPGLLRSGVQYLKSNANPPSDRVIESIVADVAIGEEDDPSFLLAAAQKIVKAMGGSRNVNFEAYLRQTVGALKPAAEKSGLAKAIAALDSSTMTVNYDTVFEQITGARTVNWPTLRSARSSLVDQETPTVLHLHGVWNEPESIILTDTDYQRIVTDSGVEALRSSIAMLRTMIFIGFGAGLHDPHFNSVWGWLSELSSGATHYAFCRTPDLSAALHAPAQSPVILVPYGEKYSDLEPFIRKLKPTKHQPAAKESIDDIVVLQRVAKTCRIKLTDSLNDSAVNKTGRDDDSTLDELVVEPILLPMPPEQFEQQKLSDDDLSQLNPLDQIREDGCITVIGEEQSGLTTTLTWMAIKRSEYDGAIPLLVDYSSLRASKNSVDKTLRTALRAAGAPLTNRQPLPYDRLCLFVDNVVASSEDSALSLIIAELNATGIPLVVFGCRPGFELRVIDVYKKTGITSLPAYLGQIGMDHATELARRVNPIQAPRIAARVLSITRKERLFRTPLAIILLIDGVTNNEDWINAVSNTSFVDSFVDSLLGRGKIRDNMHSRIDSAGYSRVLEALARKLIDDSAEAIERTSLINFLDIQVKKLDWSDRPEVLVDDLIEKGILVDRSGLVRFRQSVYLHIFAARAAVKDRDLLVHFLSRPLYYSQIIRHYAALKRDDKELLQWAFERAADFDLGTPPDSGIFGRIDDGVERRVNDRLAELSARLSLDTQPVTDESTDTEDPDRAADASDDIANTVDVVAPGDEEILIEGPTMTNIDLSDDIFVRDLGPFPATDLETAPDDVRLSAYITLVSNILRDSELVEDPDLKEKMLRSTLSAWGRYMDLMTNSEDVQGMINQIVEVINGRLGYEDERKEEFAMNLADAWSMHSANRGISEELSTAKLQRAITRISTSGTADSAHTMIPLYMLDAMHEQKFWGNGFRDYLMANSKVRAVRLFVNVFVKEFYYKSERGTAMHKALEDLLVDFFVTYGDTAKMSDRRRGRLATFRREQLSKAWHRGRAERAVERQSVVLQIQARDADRLNGGAR